MSDTCGGFYVVDRVHKDMGRPCSPRLHHRHRTLLGLCPGPRTCARQTQWAISRGWSKAPRFQMYRPLVPATCWRSLAVPTQHSALSGESDQRLWAPSSQRACQTSEAHPTRRAVRGHSAERIRRLDARATEAPNVPIKCKSHVPHQDRTAKGKRRQDVCSMFCCEKSVVSLGQEKIVCARDERQTDGESAHHYSLKNVNLDGCYNIEQQRTAHAAATSERAQTVVRMLINFYHAAIRRREFGVHGF